MDEDIIASCFLSEKGKLVLISVLVFHPTPEVGPDKGTLHLGTRVTLKVDGKPFIDHDLLITKDDYLTSYHGVSACHFFDIIGVENRKGVLMSVDFVQEISPATRHAICK